MCINSKALKAERVQLFLDRYPVDAIKAAGLDCKIIIGGAPVTADACKNIGADEWAYSPQKTTSVCKAWAE